jgi:GLPGLI family protein
MFQDTLSKDDAMEENLSLLINGNKSLFKSTKKAIADSVAKAISKKSFDNPIDGKVILNFKDVPNVNFKSEVFLDNGKQTVYKELLKNNFSYPLEEPVQWKIEGGTKMIESYLCKKAIGRYKNRNYIAWFAESVPIPDGPYVFKGLPGLVLEIYDTKNFITFSMVSFKKVEKPIILLKDVYSTDYKTYTKARKNFLDNPAAAISNRTGITIQPQYIEKVNSNARRFNNYID